MYFFLATDKWLVRAAHRHVKRDTSNFMVDILEKIIANCSKFLLKISQVFAKSQLRYSQHRVEESCCAFAENLVLKHEVCFQSCRCRNFLFNLRKKAR